jgi:catechol 2,3-dioxygenase-like lactoylglutathione lyase family enzyme
MVVGAGAAAANAQPPASIALVQAVESVGHTVSDMERSVAFYTKVLSFEIVSDVEVLGDNYDRLQGIFGLRMRVVLLRLGNEFIELTEYLTPRGRPAPLPSRSNDGWFQHVAIIVSDMDKAYQVLRQHKVEHVSPEPQRLPDWNRNVSGIRAFYFKDPDGHPLEVLEFPPDKGLPKWHRKSDKLFMGIDHTAIVVRDTEASLKFYRDLLGLKVVGKSENYGIEQERLNNVFGARLRITTLRADSGPGIELLEYLSPRDGRLMPPDERSNDIVHWQTRLLTYDVETASIRLLAGRVVFISSGIVLTPSKELGFEKGLLVRDPDGHVLQLVGR